MKGGTNWSVTNLTGVAPKPQSGLAQTAANEFEPFRLSVPSLSCRPHRQPVPNKPQGGAQGGEEEEEEEEEEGNEKAACRNSVNQTARETTLHSWEQQEEDTRCRDGLSTTQRPPWDSFVSSIWTTEVSTIPSTVVVSQQ